MVDAPSAWGTADATLTDPVVAGAPSAPVGLSFTRVGNTITLTWNAPASDGGSPILGWTVDRGAGFAGTQDDVPLVGTGPFIYEYTETASSWIDNPEYNASVRAYNATHDGAWSAPVYPYATPVVHAPSAWGTADATLTDPEPPGGWGPSAWGTADVTLGEPAPPGGYAPSAWGTAEATLSDPIGVEAVGWVDGEWVPVEPVRWVGSEWSAE